MEQTTTEFKDPESANLSIVPKGWKNAPTLEDLKKDLEGAKQAHDVMVARVQRWLDNLHITGTAKITPPKGYSKIQPKLIRKQAEWRYAALSEPFLATRELFKIDPVTWEDVEAARQNALVLNNQFNTKIDKQAFIDAYVRAGVDEGTIIVKVGWEAIEEEVAEEQPIVEYYPNPEMGELHQELAQMREQNPTGYEAEVPEELKLAHDFSMENGAPFEAVITGYEEVMVSKVIANHPVLEVCNYKDVIPDPSCKGDLDKAGFVIHRFQSTMGDLRRDGRYKNLDAVLVPESSPLSDPDNTEEDTTGNFSFQDDPRKIVQVYEYTGYYDMTGTGIPIPFVAAWVGNALVRMDPTPFPDKKIPFVFIPVMPKKESLYGEPDGELLEDNQNIIGAVTRGMIDIMGRSANGQMGTRKDALDAVNRRKFVTGRDYEFNGNVDPRMAFHMHTYPEIPQSAQFMLQHNNYEAESMTGVKAFSNGINSDSLGKVATGINGAIDAAAKRETGILRRFAAGMIKIGRKVVAMNAEFLEDSEIVRITNDNIVAIRREDLAGNFDLSMDISTLEEDNVKAQELAFMVQTMGNSVDQGITQIVLRDIARLRKMPELAHEIANFKPEPDPMQQKIQELQIQKLEAEIMEIQSRAMENQSDAELNSAKAGTEQAKARHLSSTADLQNLDFIETESGVKQERAKEIQGEQARGNMALESHKRNLDREDTQVSSLQEYLNKK